MTDNNNQIDLEDNGFSGIRERSPWYARILSSAKGCEFAICGVVALIIFVKPLPIEFAFASLAAIVILGVASAGMRR